MAKLGEVCDFYAGTGFPNEYQGRATGKYPFYKVGDISKNVLEGNRELKTCANYVEEDVVQKLKGSILPPKTIVFAKIGEALKLNRRAITSCECLVDNNVMGIKAQNVRLNDEYLFYWLQNLNLSDYSESTTVPSVKKSRLQNIEINVSPLEEQEKVVSTLNKLSSLILARKKQLSKLDELVKARFVEMFGDSVANTKNFPSTTLETVMTVFPQNGLYKPQTDYVQDNTGIPILRIDAFYNGKVTNWNTLKRLICSETEINRYLLRENDIVINRVNSIEYLGKCAHIVGLKEKTVFESNMMRFHMDEKKVNAVYVTEVLCTEDIYRQILRRAKKSVNQASINQEDVKSLEILVPPLSLQNQFAAFVERVDQQKQTVQQSLEKLELMKKALMQEYFG